MIAENKMTETGLKHFNNITEQKITQYNSKIDKSNFRIPEYIKKEFKENPTANENFNNLAFSYKKKLYRLDKQR